MAALHRVYPRVCGGTTSKITPAAWATGLSPRVRGNLEADAVGYMGPGSIPACAGEPQRPPAIRPVDEVYPRVCGGNRFTVSAAAARYRSIPACAGEPYAGRPIRAIGAVYPRVCGGTHEPLAATANASGLSPRVRGNRDQSHAD